MALPTPPTDNLYKFMAITGLALMVLSFVPLEIAVRDLHLRAIELGGQNKILTIELQRLNEQSEAAPHAPGKSGDERREHLRDLWTQARIKQAQIATTKEQLEATLEKYRDYVFFSSVGVGIGGFLSVLGFSLWYKRLQRYQDEAIRASTRTSDTTPPHGA